MVCAVVMIRGAAKAQGWNNGANGGQYMDSPTDGVLVGTSSTAPPSALTVDGNEMTPTTGEVFRTDAPNGSEVVDLNWTGFRQG